MPDVTTDISLQNNIQDQSDQLPSERFSEHGVIIFPISPHILPMGVNLI